MRHPAERVVARAPGRVNLMGDHTDYAGGLCLPVAIDLVTEVRGVRDGSRTVTLSSDSEDEVASVRVDEVARAGRGALKGWVRYVEGVTAEVRPASGFKGQVTSTIPGGAGLASSAALELAIALALGFSGSPVELALVCQRAEQAAAGVPCGLMDQLASATGCEGHALLMDPTRLSVTPVPVPEGVGLAAVHSGTSRSLTASGYAKRRAEADAAAAIVGPLPERTLDDVRVIEDEVLRRRARHVISETSRVLSMAEALRSRDLGSLGEIMAESQASLSRDCEVSSPELDALVAELVACPGVLGARLTGAGFGGCAVVLEEPGALARAQLRRACWSLNAYGGARVERLA